MALSLTGAKPFAPVAAAGPAAARRPRRSACVPRAQQIDDSAPAAVDRRALLLGAGAVLAGAAVQQTQPAAAEECIFTTAANGLQWCDVRVGDGESPVAGARIRAHYTGRLASNGAVFDSSYERGKPLVFQVGVGQVIKGWDQGIVGTDDIPPMKEGGLRKLIIPAELAYGDRSVGGGLIPAKSVLAFDVELLGKYGKR